MERLPMDRLLLNNRTIKSNQCQKQEYPALKCLQSDLLQLNLKKCTENYTLSFDYSYDNAEIYETVAILKPKYEHKIRLLYPPKTKHSQVDITYNSTNDTITLICEVECGQVETYHWYLNSNNSTMVLEASNLHIFTLNNSIHDFKSIEFVYCEVSNSIHYVNPSLKKESITEFRISLYEEKTSTTTTTLVSNTTTNNSSKKQYNRNFLMILLLILINCIHL